MTSMPASDDVPRDARIGYVLLIATIAFVAAAKAVLFGPVDPDLFLHLIAADHIAHNGVGPIVDTTSYVSSKEPWTPYSWLAELFMRWLLEAGGYRAAVVTYAVCSVAIVALIAMAGRFAQRHRGGEPAARGSLLAVVVATGLGTVLTLPYLSFRPVTMAFVVMAGCVALVYRDRAIGERTRAVWLVLPLSALLVNLHLFAVLMPMWLAGLAVGALVEHRRASIREETGRRLKRSIGLAAGAALACLATPLLPGAVAALFRYGTGDPMVTAGLVDEFKPFYSGPMGKVSLAIVVGTLGLMLARREKLRVGDWMTALFATALLLKMGRMAPVWAMLVAPLLACCLGGNLSDGVVGRPAIRVVLTIVLIVGAFRLINGLPPTGDTLATALARRPSGYPVAAAEFVAGNIPRQSGRLVNDYSWGGFLAWRFAGERQVLLTGNTSIYGRVVWDATYFCDDATRRQTLATTNADAAVVPVSGSPIATALGQLGWKEIYRDDIARVLVPNDSIAKLQD
jgi:hypothetical protein